MTAKVEEAAARHVMTRTPGPGERNPRAIRRRRRVLEVALAIAVPVVLLAAWQLAAQAGAIDPRLYPPPSAIAQEFVRLSADGQLALET